MSVETVRAVLCRDCTGNTRILATDSASVEFDCEELGASADDIGMPYLDPTRTGLWLWVGARVVGSMGGPDGWDDPEVTYEAGELRAVPPKEQADLLALAPPVQDDDDPETPS